MPQFRVLEFWRLTAAIGVMGFHFLRYASPEQQYIADTLYRMMPVMDMFFMISGFVIMLRYGDTLLDSGAAYRRFIVRRAARIYPLYLATLAFFILIGLAVHLGFLNTARPERFDFSTLPHNIFLIQAWGTTDHLTFNYVGWTLSSEWFCYLAFPLVVIAFRFCGNWGIAALGLLCLGALEIASSRGLVPDGHWLQSLTWGAFRAFVDFTAGALIARLVTGSSWKLSRHSPAWIVFVISIAAMLAQANSYLVFLLLMLAIYLAGLAELNNPNGSRLLQITHPVGAVSFGIYILHPVVEVFFWSLLWRKVLEPSASISIFAYMWLPMIISVLVAMASDRWFQRPVGLALANKLERRTNENSHAAPAE